MKKRFKKISYNELLHSAGVVHKRMKEEFNINGYSKLYYELKDKLYGVSLFTYKSWGIDTEEFFNDLYNKQHIVNRNKKKNSYEVA